MLDYSLWYEYFLILFVHGRQKSLGIAAFG